MQIPLCNHLDFREACCDAVDVLADRMCPRLVDIANALNVLGSTSDPWADFRSRRAITSALAQFDEAWAELISFLHGANITFMEGDASCQI